MVDGLVIRYDTTQDVDGLPPGEWHGLVATNVLGPALTARAVLPALTRSGGHLLLTGSVAGRVTRPGSLYSADARIPRIRAVHPHRRTWRCRAP